MLGTLPENCLIGLITFGSYVQVHELGFGQIPKVYVFKGSKEITKDQILEQMGFFLKKPKPTTGVIAGARDGLSQESISRFLLPASECEFTLNSVCSFIPLCTSICMCYVNIEIHWHTLILYRNYWSLLYGGSFISQSLCIFLMALLNA